MARKRWAFWYFHRIYITPIPDQETHGDLNFYKWEHWSISILFVNVYVQKITTKRIILKYQSTVFFIHKIPAILWSKFFFLGEKKTQLCTFFLRGIFERPYVQVVTTYCRYENVCYSIPRYFSLRTCLSSLAERWSLSFNSSPTVTSNSTDHLPSTKVIGTERTMPSGRS